MDKTGIARGTYAAGIMAEYAPQVVYVDGASVQMEAYNIGGHNYVKLRDIGQAVGFNIYGSLPAALKFCGHHGDNHPGGRCSGTTSKYPHRSPMQLSLKER